MAAENFLNENMQTISDQDVAALTDDAADSAEEALDARCRRERSRAKRSIPTPALSAAFPGRGF